MKNYLTVFLLFSVLLLFVANLFLWQRIWVVETELQQVNNQCVSRNELTAFVAAENRAHVAHVSRQVAEKAWTSLLQDALGPGRATMQEQDALGPGRATMQEQDALGPGRATMQEQSPFNNKRETEN